MLGFLLYIRSKLVSNSSQKGHYMLKPFSQACQNNAKPILDVLQRILVDTKTVLEIGSGTGQHAVYFGKHLSYLQWQTSDLLANHQGIGLWLDDAGLNNVLPPIEIDISNVEQDIEEYDAIFISNVLHIINSKQVEQLFTILAKAIEKKGYLIIYGPFNYEGQFTSDSNMRFDQWLKAADSKRGIRDFERVNKLAQDAGFIIKEDNSLPANNRLLIWQFEG